MSRRRPRLRAIPLPTGLLRAEAQLTDAQGLYAAAFTDGLSPVSRASILRLAGTVAETSIRLASEERAPTAPPRIHARATRCLARATVLWTRVLEQADALGARLLQPPPDAVPYPGFYGRHRPANDIRRPRRRAVPPPPPSAVYPSG